MILARHRQFVDPETLQLINQELTNTPGWIYRTNFWRYYLVDGLEPYQEHDPSTWYHHQSAIHNLRQPWADLFKQVYELAGPNFRLQRYALTGQTQGQHQTLHYDTTLNPKGTFRSYLLYLNVKWDQDQGGSTDFAFEDLIVHQEWPEPGKLVVFDSQALHCGNPPAVPNVLRTTMVLHGQLV